MFSPCSAKRTASDKGLPVSGLFFEGEKMSFVEKRFCFSCKLDAEQLKKKNKELQTCSYCKIAQYCGKQCQRRDLKDSHKNLCVRGFKKYDDLTKQAKDILKDQGHDLDTLCLKKCSSLQVNLCQKLLFLHQLTHSMKTDCPLNYKFNT